MWPEVLPAFGIIVGCITVTGLALKYLDRYEHSGKVSVYMCCVEWWALIGTLSTLRYTAREIQSG